MYSGQDLIDFNKIVTAVITQEDFRLENIGESIKSYLKKLEKNGTLSLRESDEGFVDVILNKELRPLFRSFVR